MNRPTYLASLADDVLLDEPEDHQGIVDNILDVRVHVCVWVWV